MVSSEIYVIYNTDHGEQYTVKMEDYKRSVQGGIVYDKSAPFPQGGERLPWQWNKSWLRHCYIEFDTGGFVRLVVLQPGDQRFLPGKRITLNTSNGSRSGTVTSYVGERLESAFRTQNGLSA